ncbi:MAG TPA: helix-turn-helix transcriptional regulator, partial [Methylomirabilota bacterium]|nr:helix-turn-helix transcriptional regulator [Methylomirabilota bacterium]
PGQAGEMSSEREHRIRRRILGLCYAGLQSRTLRVEVLKALRQVVSVDAVWWATADPATLLPTGAVVEEIPEQATPAFVVNEFLQDDVNKFVHLVRCGHAVSSLFAATRGHPTSSRRYREILRPLGYGDELRAVQATGSSCWGLMCLHRERARAGFSDADAELLRRLTPHLAQGLRTALLLPEATAAPAASEGPGLLEVAEDLSPVAVTPAAEAWLAELPDWPPRRELPQAVCNVVGRLLALERDDIGHVDLPPRVRIRTRSGRWLVLHAARLVGPGADGRIAIMFELARPLDVAPLVLEAFGLTDREMQVMLLVLRGYSTEQVSARLVISPLTVQQHLKAIFDKTGVRSRRELVARIFAEQSRPTVSLPIERIPPRGQDSGGR